MLKATNAAGASPMLVTVNLSWLPIFIGCPILMFGPCGPKACKMTGVAAVTTDTSATSSANTVFDMLRNPRQS
jgi:hypothetical protein